MRAGLLFSSGIVATWLLAAGCTPGDVVTPPTDGGFDAGAGADSGRDAGTDAGTGDSGAPADAGPADAGTPYVTGLVTVGYGGLRVVSRDRGQSWGDASHFTDAGGDDTELLRGVAWGNGLWISVGWKFVTSNDGVHWTDHGLLSAHNGQDLPSQLIESLTFANGAFYVPCTPYNSPTQIYRSSDGVHWVLNTDATGDGGVVALLGGHEAIDFHAGTFTIYGDNGTTYQSTDAISWSVLPGLTQGVFCDGGYVSSMQCGGGAKWIEGGYLSGQWENKILRSTDGASFNQVYADPWNDGLARPGTSIAEGLVAP
jgi:hypothetical protein